MAYRAAWRSTPASGYRSTGGDTEQSRQRALDSRGRESGTARLEEAVVAYRAALEEYSRERVPLDWARHRTISAPRSGFSGGARAGRRGWRRLWWPIARRWRNTPASACRSTGR